MKKQKWKKFQESGLLWWVNRSLCLFGWVIVVEEDESSGDIISVYPKRVKYRGFCEDVEERGFETLTKHLADNSEALVKETKTETI